MNKKLDFVKEAIKEFEEGSCALMGCKDVIPQNLREVIDDKTNTKMVIEQAKTLLKLGFKDKDYFCQRCFWK